MSIKYQLNNDIIVIDDEYSLDLYVNNQKMHLYPQSQKILRLLIERGLHGWKTPTEIIIGCLWPEAIIRDKSYNNSIRTCIKLLRSVLGKETIVTENDVGYYLRNKPIILDQNLHTESICFENKENSPDNPNTTFDDIKDDILKYTFSDYVEKTLDVISKTEKVAALTSIMNSFYDSAKERLEWLHQHIPLHQINHDDILKSLSVYSEKLDNEYIFIQKYNTEKEDCIKMFEHLIDSVSLIPPPNAIKSPIKQIDFDNTEYEAILNKSLILSSKIEEIIPKIEEICDELKKHRSNFENGIYFLS